MGSNLPAVQINLCRMAHPFEFYAHISGTADIPFIACPAPIGSRIRTAFPAAGYRRLSFNGLFFPCSGNVQKSQRQEEISCVFLILCVANVLIMLYNLLFFPAAYSLTAPIMTPFTKCF